MAIRTKEFYAIQNKVIDKLALTKLSPNEGKYCWEVFRKTFAFGKYKDYISRDTMARLTCMAGTTVSDVKKRLVERNIIHHSSKNTGFNTNTDQWEKVKVSLPFGKVKVSLPKGQGKAEKKGQGIITHQRTTKKLSKEGGAVLKKLGIKEVEKLEGKKWLKQVMWQRYNFKEKFIDQILNKWEFEACYNVLLSYEESHGVRDKEAWFLAKLERGPETEE